MTINHITLIGLGLLGSSIGHAVRKFSSHIKISGYDISPDVVGRAKELDFIDEGFDAPQDAVQNADMVILSAPLGVFGTLAELIIPAMKKGAILTDTGSVKGSIVKAITPFVNDKITFIPAHPIAGTERSGPDAGFADLFVGKKVILTPLEGTPVDKIKLLTDFWEAFGASAETMDIDHHDLVFAVVSHIPHLIAYNIVGTAAHLETVTEQEVIRYSASGFRDFTRLASSDPVIWRDVFLHNKDAVLEMLGRFVEDLFTLQRAIRYSDAEALEAVFRQTRHIRKSIIEAGQDTADVDFGRHNKK